MTTSTQSNAQVAAISAATFLAGKASSGEYFSSRTSGTAITDLADRILTWLNNNSPEDK